MLQTSVATLCFSEVWLLLSDIFELAWNQRAERNEGRGLKTVDAVLSLPVYREFREFREIRELGRFGSLGRLGGQLESLQLCLVRGLCSVRRTR